jgi:hypothetical protein
MKNKMSEAWREWWSITHGKNTPAGSYNPLEAHMYEAWVAAWDSANEHAQFEITHLKEQLLRVGNQQEVLKAAYLAGQMSRPVKTFSGGKPNYVIPPETPEVTPYVTPDDRGSTGEV